jgi:CDP-diacylglycerol---glycerol-3-phosphate 3-phosphatidyltransferase
MIVRSLGVQALRQCIKKPSVSRVVVRKFSTPPLSPQPSASTAHPLVGVTTQFDHVAPRFEIEPSEIKILNSPTAFYETLKVVEADNKLGPTG